MLCSTAAEEEQTARLLVNEGYSVVRAGDGDGEEIFDEYLSKKGKTLPIVTLTANISPDSSLTRRVLPSLIFRRRPNAGAFFRE